MLWMCVCVGSDWIASSEYDCISFAIIMVNKDYQF